MCSCNNDIFACNVCIRVIIKKRSAWEGVGVKQVESMYGDNANTVVMYKILKK